MDVIGPKNLKKVGNEMISEGKFFLKELWKLLIRRLLYFFFFKLNKQKETGMMCTLWKIFRHKFFVNF